MQNIIRDLRLSVRSLIRSPVLGATIVLTVGLGIGGTVAVFSIVHAALIKPLPYAEPGRLVRIYHDYPPNRWPLSVADWLAIQEQQTTFTSVAAYRNWRVTYSDGDRAEQIRAKYVTAEYFSLLGIVPLQGRLFTAADDVPGAEPTVVVGHAFWQNELGGDPSRVGRPIRLNGVDRTVIGVLPASTAPLEKRIGVFPIAQLEPPSRKGPFFLTILGRLRSGVAPGVAAAELRAIEERIFPIWQASFPNPTSTYGMMPLNEFVAGDVRTKLTILLIAVAFVLLIASTNAANLLVARGAQRRRELAVRAALGASRGRLVRELLTESGLLALVGAVLGVGLAALAIHVLRGVGPEVIPRAQEMGLTGPVLGFAAAVTMGSALLFALVPSVQAIRADLEEALRAGGRGSGESKGTQRFRRALVMSEFAVAVPLLIGAGLLLTSFARLYRVNPGVDVGGVITANVTLPSAAYEKTEAVVAFWEEAASRIRALPGVIAVGEGTGVPVRGSGMQNNINLEDRPTPPDQLQPNFDWPIVTAGYFDALQIPLLRGRMFDERDQLGSPVVALVDRAWVKNVFPGEEVIGKRFHQGGCTTAECPWVTVIGVVGNVKYDGLDAPEAGTIYTPLSIWPSSSRTLFVRTPGDQLAVLPAVRNVIRQMDPLLPLSDVATMRDILDESLAQPRNLLVLVAGFAAIALLLAAIGIYGVMVYFVQRRSKDMAIRLAMGGSPAQVLRLVVRQGMLLVGGGVAIGVVGALALTRYMSSVLFEVGVTDPVTFASVAFGVVIVALSACLLPARHVARVNPAAMLREE